MAVLLCLGFLIAHHGWPSPSLCRLQGGLKEFIILSLQDTRRERARGGHTGYVIIIITLAAVRTARDPTSQHNSQAEPTRRGSADQAGARSTEGCLARSPASAKDREFSVFASQRQ